MTTPYLDVAGFKAITLMPSSYVDELEVDAPGWLLRVLTSYSRFIDARLAKRYATPFATPYPEVVEEWLARLVTHRCFLKRGFDPEDPEAGDYRDDAISAKEELLEAANSEDGLYDLPLRADVTESGIDRGGPFGYSEASPYVGFDLQRETGRDEDRAGSGSHG